MCRSFLPRLGTLTLLAFFAPAQGTAAPVAARTNAGGSAAVLSPLSIIKKTDLDFGDLIVGGAGTAVINPISGALSTTGTLTPSGTNAHRAVFTAVGTGNIPVIIRIPKNPVALTRVGGTETMSAAGWTLDGPTTRMIPSNRAFDFGVGATLTVGAGQASGTYVGTFDVTVQYP